MHNFPVCGSDWVNPKLASWIDSKYSSDFPSNSPSNYLQNSTNLHFDELNGVDGDDDFVHSVEWCKCELLLLKSLGGVVNPPTSVVIGGNGEIHSILHGVSSEF